MTPLDVLVQTLFSMAGFAMLVAVLINLGKALHIVQDTTAPIWSMVLNFIGLLLLAFGKFINLDFLSLDPVFMVVAQLLGFILTYITGLGASKLANLFVKGLPVIGFSYSLRAARVQKLSNLQKINIP